MGSAGSGGIGGRSATGSTAVSEMPEHVLFSDIEAGAAMSSVLLHSNDMAVFSSSEAVRSMASPSALAIEDLSSSVQRHKLTLLYQPRT